MKPSIRIALLSLCVLSAGPAAAAIHVVDCTVGPFFTIQDAVDVAAPGDTIVVHSCTYNESVLISGHERLSLVAADSGVNGSYAAGVGAVVSSPVVVNASGTGGPCFRVSLGNHVTITGFRMVACGTYGILSDGDAHHYHGNRIQGAAISGINDAGSNTRITGNLVAVNGFVGIFLEASRAAQVSDNRVVANASQGIWVVGDLNQVVNNQVTSNGLEGIVIDTGVENRVERNTSSGNGGVAQMLIGTFSDMADVAGNDNGGSLVDSGTGTELQDNF